MIDGIRRNPTRFNKTRFDGPGLASTRCDTANFDATSSDRTPLNRIRLDEHAPPTIATREKRQGHVAQREAHSARQVGGVFYNSQLSTP